MYVWQLLCRYLVQLIAVKYSMEITFDRGPIYTAFSFSNASYTDISSAIALIHECTQAKPHGYQFMPRYKMHQWDGYIRLCKGSKFPTGLLQSVIDNLREYGIHNLTINSYPIPGYDVDAIQENMLNGVTLRPYQVEAIKTLLAYGRGIAKMATNSGKTEVIAAMAKVVPGSVLVLVTKKDLLYQTSERIEMRLGEKVGIIGDDVWKSSNRIVVGMIQTLSKHLDWVHLNAKDTQLAMYDETHHLPSATSEKVMLGIPAPYRFGFSGTPLKNDNLADLTLIGATGPVLVDIPNSELIEQGISAEPFIEMYNVDGGVLYMADWQEAYGDCIVGNYTRNTLITKLVVESAAPSALILVERLEHGQLLHHDIPDSIFVHGSSQMEERQSALDQLRAGTGVVVIATPIFDEGVDVPAVNLLVLAGGGKAPIKLLQRIGRGMRRKENDNTLRVIDFVDDTNKYLLKHSLERAKIYEQEGFNVKVLVVNSEM